MFIRSFYWYWIFANNPHYNLTSDMCGEIMPQTHKGYTYQCGMIERVHMLIAGVSLMPTLSLDRVKWPHLTYSFSSHIALRWPYYRYTYKRALRVLQSNLFIHHHAKHFSLIWVYKSTTFPVSRSPLPLL